MILNLEERYMAKLDTQFDYVENMINQHRGQITDAILQIATLKAMLPLANKETALTKEGLKTSEHAQYKNELNTKVQEVRLRQAAIDALLPEYERLRALKDAADAEKAEAAPATEEAKTDDATA